MDDTPWYRVIAVGVFLFTLSLPLVPASAQKPLWDPGSTLTSTGSGILDTHTLKCMGCHEYDTKSQVLEISNTNASTMGMGSSPLSGHPVGARYQDVAASSSGRRYRSTDSLNEVILLPDGLVSCVTCHEDNDIFSQPHEHGKLVMSNRGSRLCLECHNM